MFEPLFLQKSNKMVACLRLLNTKNINNHEKLLFTVNF